MAKGDTKTAKTAAPGVIMQHPDRWAGPFNSGDTAAEVIDGKMTVPFEVVEAAKQAGFVVIGTEIGAASKTDE